MRELRTVGSAVLLGLLLLLTGTGCPVDAPPSDRADGARASTWQRDAGRLETAFAERRSDLWVEVRGTVIRRLPDDREGSRHQRFILEVEGSPSGQTLLVSHNLDLAPRVPLEVGDPVVVAGEYEWNDRGGVVHWTHHDPARRHRPSGGRGGFIRHRGTVYR